MGVELKAFVPTKGTIQVGVAYSLNNWNRNLHKAEPMKQPLAPLVVGEAFHDDLPDAFAVKEAGQ